jgi:omega-amidase
MRVYAAQLDLAWHDGPENARRLETMLEGVAPEAGDLLVLPEMSASGFTADVEAAVAASDWLEKTLASIARDTKAFVLAGLVRKTAEGPGRNLAVCFGPGGEVGHYQKIHPFLGFEQHHYLAGRDAVVWTLGEWSVRPAVCYDLRFPELFRVGDPMRRPELIVVIASWPSPRANHWSTLLRARAIENQCYVVGVNRTGRDPNHEYPGRGLIVGPSGETLAEADDRPQMLCATLRLDEVRRLRTALPFQPDQRLGVSLSP